jgi:hypothetical protein
MTISAFAHKLEIRPGADRAATFTGSQATLLGEARRVRGMPGL